MKNVVLIGAGNIGSRHLQALKAVKIPLEVFVVDPINQSLELARSRYESMPKGKSKVNVNYLTSLSVDPKQIDLAIIATCSDIRANVVRNLLKRYEIKYLILEKLLFNKKSDYDFVGALLKKAGTKTWVNCPMRMMPAYSDLQTEFAGKTIFYNASWGGYGLVTSAIHYLDHMVFLTGSDDFVINTDGINKKQVQAKRKGFLELTGGMRALFKNGSIGELICNNTGNAPPLVQFHSSETRCIVKETESKRWASRAKDNWQWEETGAAVPFQSQLTTKLAEDILIKGNCLLPGFEQSKKIHLQLLEPLRLFLNKNSKKKYDYYPFT